MNIKLINLKSFFRTNDEKGNSTHAEIEYNNLPTDIRVHFNRIYLFSIITASFSISTGIVSKSFYYFAILISISLILALFNTYHVIKTLSGSVICIEGECIDVNYAKAIGKILSYQRSFLTIKAYNKDTHNYSFIITSIPNRTFWSSYKKGNIIRIYAPAKSFFNSNDDTYRVNDSYYIYCIKSNITVSKEEEKESRMK